MKKQTLSIGANLLSLMALFLLFSSFTYLANSHAAAVETKQSFWTAAQGFSLEKLSFWQKTALLLGASSVSTALVHQQYHRHYGEGMGCLGVLGIIILIPIVIFLLPVILVVGLFMFILGIPFPRFRDRGYRGGHRHYRRERF